MFIVGSWMKNLGVKNGDDSCIFWHIGMKNKTNNKSYMNGVTIYGNMDGQKERK